MSEANNHPRQPFFKSFQALNPTTPELEKFQTLLVEVFKKASPGIAFQALPLIHEQLAVPVLIILATKTPAEDDAMGVHIVAIETEEAQFPPEAILYQGRQLQSERSVADAVNRTFYDVTAKFLTEQFPNTRFFHSAARVLYRTTDLNDPAAIHRLANSIATAATADMLMTLYDGRELNLAEMKGPRHSLKTEFNPAAHYDEMGLPVRRDIKLSLMTLAPSVSDRQPVDQEVGHVAGFVDVIPLPGKKFMPRFVITQIEPSKRSPDILSLQMLLLVTATALTENNLWQEALLRPNYAADHPRDMRRLHPGLTYDVLANSDQTTKLLEEVFHPGLIFSLDVANAGSDTWRTDYWAAVVHGNSEAYSHLCEVADLLTDGRFSYYFPTGAPIAISENNLIPMGYYTDRLGDKRDIREVDQLFVNTITQENNDDVGAAWAATYLNINIPVEVRVAERQQMIRGLVGRLVFTDTATRVTFTVEFIQAMRNAVRDCGFMVQVPKTKDNAPLDYPYSGATNVPSADARGVFHDQPRFGGFTGPRTRY